MLVQPEPIRIAATEVLMRLGPVARHEPGLRLLPTLLPRPRSAMDAGRQAWNIDPAHGHDWTVPDSSPMPTSEGWPSARWVVEAMVITVRSAIVVIAHGGM